MEPLCIKSRQKVHIEKLISILADNCSYFDASPMGSGKTISAIALSIFYGLKLFVVCPANNIGNWKLTIQKYGVEVVDVISYTMFRGTESGCNHPYLNRINTRSNRGSNKCKYQVTDELQSIIRQNTLFIFDEIHMVKNYKTYSHQSCHTVTNEIVRLNNLGLSLSRIGLLSALPVATYEEIGAILQIMGYIRSRTLVEYHTNDRSYRPTGLLELYQYCDIYDPEMSRRIREGICVNSKTVPTIVSNLYEHILRDRVSSSMPQPEMALRADIKNVYYDVSAEDEAEMNTAYQMLLEATQYDTLKKEVRKVKSDNVMTAIGRLERAKVNVLTRITNNILDNVSGSKVIIYVWRSNSTAKMLNDKLAEYHPIVLTGNTEISGRDGLIAEFQENNSRRRVIIAHPEVGGIGHNLDDRDGNFPRYVLVSPGRSLNKLHQVTGRTARETSKSVSHIRFVYAKGYEEEINIMNSLACKSKEARVMLPPHLEIKLPSDYPICWERDDDPEYRCKDADPETNSDINPELAESMDESMDSATRTTTTDDDISSSIESEMEVPRGGRRSVPRQRPGIRAPIRRISDPVDSTRIKS